MDKTYSAAASANIVMQRIGDPTKEVPIRKKYKASVVENKHQGDGNKVLFHIEELVPLTRGHLKDNPIPMKRVYTDSNGRVFTSRGTHNNNFVGEYYSNDSLRKTPPDVQRGEIILVWQKSDTDDWYWEDTTEDHLSKRRLETVVHAINADKPVGPDAEKYDDDNIYYTEMSSHNKTYTISTSEANKEIAAYKFQINAGEGSVVTQDNVGNHIQIDTVGTEIHIHNANGTEIKLTRDNIWVFCRDKMEMQVGGNVIINVKGNADVNVQGTSNINVKGDTSLTTPNFNIKGNVNLEGNLAQKGNLSTSGTVDADGNVSSKAAITGGDGSTMGKGGASIKGPLSATGSLKADGPVDFPSGGNISGYRRG